MSLKKTLRKLTEERAAIDEYIKELEKKKKKPEDNSNGKGLGIIHQSMLLMLTVIPLGVMDLLLIKWLFLPK